MYCQNILWSVGSPLNYIEPNQFACKQTDTVLSRQSLYLADE